MNSDSIKDIYIKEISLFRELLHCVSMERENLIHLDLKSLWSIMEEKQEILEAIEKIREERTALTGGSVSYYDLPNDDRRKIMHLSNNLSVLKEEIKTRVAENMSFINESLDFFHEVFSILTSSGDLEDQYGPLRKNRLSHPNTIYRNEV